MSAPTLRRDPRPTSPPPLARGPVEPPPPPPRGRPPVSDGALNLVLGLLMVTALIPMQRVFIGGDWRRPVLGAALLALGIGWGSRQLRVGPITHLVMSATGLLVFAAIAFVPDTTAAGVVPTGATLADLRDLFVYGLELVELRPSPTFAEAGLLLLAVAGTWVVAYLADGMLFVLRSGALAIASALVLWAVPLAVAPTADSILLPAATMVAAAGLLVLLTNTVDTASWGARVGADADQRGRAPVGVVMLSVVVVLGTLLAGVLPGFQERPVYRLRGSTGTTITTNPIVNIQDRLVATNTGPVVRVDSPRPVYLRTTALDTFNEREEWGIDGNIVGSSVSGRVDQSPAIPTEVVDVEVLVAGIEPGAILAPIPFRTVEVGGERSGDMRYDPSLATLTVPGDSPLERGDAYRVTAELPQPDAEALRTVPHPGAGFHTALPANVPAAATDLANEIVAAAGATTMFDQALAIQNTLRTWTYSVQPDLGPGATAIERFINGRQGYCEQFAGTMAVMLRSLGIPARLAVGYTPGTLAQDGLWVVTNANAHAWVEVDFGSFGWIAFEPTPRTDGNVLVPDLSSIVPSQTAAMDTANDGTFEPSGPGELPEARPSIDPRLEEGEAPVNPGDATAGAGPSDADSSPLPWLLALLGVTGVAVWTSRRRRSVTTLRPPAERIERARRRAERAGAALGSPRESWETDSEYFGRLADGHPSGQALAGPSTRADYAPAVTEVEARSAESAAATLRGRLTLEAGRRQRFRLAVKDLLAR